MNSPATFFKCLSDETRLRIMLLLRNQGELCVCELTHALDLSQPKISRHLAQLRQCGLLVDSRRGQWVFYRINPDLQEWSLEILDTLISTVKDHPLYQHDLERLRSMTDRPGEAVCCK